MGSGAKSYMRKGFLIYEEVRKFFPIYEEAVSHKWLCTRSLWISLYMRKICILLFISVVWQTIPLFNWQKIAFTLMRSVDNNKFSRKFSYAFFRVESLKGTVSWDRFQKCWRKWTDLGLIKGRGWFLNFLEAPLIFSWIKPQSPGKC